jgi:hypothetical protein
MKQGKWLGALSVATLLSCQAIAGEFQIGVRLGATKLEVDADRLTSGDDVNDRLLSSSLTVGYRWENGLIVDGGFGGSSQFLPLFEINELDQVWVGAGWQFDADRWRFTPLAGLVQTHLNSSQENLFEGNEPTDHFNDTVPFAEITAERQLGRHFVLGLYFRKNFEDFGSTQTWGMSIGLNFD